MTTELGPSSLPSPNVEHVAVWNDILAPKFIRFRQVMIDGLGAHGRIALARRPAQPGERVLDVGCGFGDATIDLARQAGPSGAALGIDCCEPFLAIARAEAARAGVPARFQLADAQVEKLAPEFDLCFSRFGTMFFQNPVAAMANLRRGMKPGGRLMMLVWRRIDDNDWMGLPKQIARAHLPPPAEEAATCGPGPFSMADPDTVRAVMSGAGWAGVELERIDAAINVGRALDEAIAFQLAVGPAGEIVREARELGDARRPLIEAELAALLRRFETEEGVVMGSSSWCVTAHASA
jgi:ubiquinone/menaquinone biosynthesis C-methylase UbiE